MLVVDWLVAMDHAVYVLVKFIRGLLYFSLNILHCTSLTFHCDLDPVVCDGNKYRSMSNVLAFVYFRRHIKVLSY